jgi:hypothetical protein
MNLALAQSAAWRRAGFDLHVLVNVAVGDLLDADLPVQIVAALERHQLPPNALVIEVTESSVFSDPVRIGDFLMRLDQVGVGILARRFRHRLLVPRAPQEPPCRRNQDRPLVRRPNDHQRGRLRHRPRDDPTRSPTR